MLFTEFALSKEIQQAVDRMGFTLMTEIQQKALPPMMQGRDIVAKAPTGTGKTCAFGIPLLSLLDAKSKDTQCLVLAPTRELAQQIAADLTDLAHFMPEVKIACLYGGQPIVKQISHLKDGAQIVVATPGRLLDHKERKSLRMDKITRIVLDEADEMLDMGFYKDVRKIIDSIKNKQQIAMFSATISDEVLDISWLYQKNPEEIFVQPVENSMPKITQYVIETTGRNKLPDIAGIIVKQDYQRVMVFCNTKYTTDMFANQLSRLNFSADCLHGDLSQGERNAIMAKFKGGQLRVLVATDVAARGIDVEGVDAVINYDVPSANEYYTHRIGRTARAGSEGVSYLFYMPDEAKRVKELLLRTKSNAEHAKIGHDGNLEILPNKKL